MAKLYFKRHPQRPGNCEPEFPSSIYLSAIHISTCSNKKLALPYYIQRLKEKVIDFKQTLDKMPPANITVSIAKKTFSNDKLKRLATVSSKTVQIDAMMVKSYKQKFREHNISYALVKKHKATWGA